MRVFSIIGSKKMSDNVTPGILRALGQEGYSVGFIKKTEQISSNSTTKKAVIWGEHQSLHYYEGEQTLHDLLKLFDEDYIVVEGDEKSNIPKLLLYEDMDIENTTDVSEIGLMNNLKRRDDLFYTAKKDTSISDMVDAIKEKVYDILPDFEPDSCDLCGKSCRELGNAIIRGEALREDCTIDSEPVELRIGDEKLKMTTFVRNILKNSVEAVAGELDGYKEGEEILVKIKKRNG